MHHVIPGKSAVIGCKNQDTDPQHVGGQGDWHSYQQQDRPLNRTVGKEVRVDAGKGQHADSAVKAAAGIGDFKCRARKFDCISMAAESISQGLHQTCRSDRTGSLQPAGNLGKQSV